MIKVCKFGGTSMSKKETIEQVIKIIQSDASRKYVIVSAPGKRYSDDEKITDLLYQAYNERFDDRQPSFDKIRDRYRTIARELDVDVDINKYLDEVAEGIEVSRTSDYAASRGEYLCAVILAKKLGWDFIDAADIIKFDRKGRFDSETTNDLVSERLSQTENAVIGGFYGSMPDGVIKTFTRGGSDVTGAIIARGAKAMVYENWTDVNGFMTTDPRIVNNPKHIDVLSYEELRELAYMGANVLHPESIFPLKNSKIPINIRNTFEPENKGTTIVHDTSNEQNRRLVTGIAGRIGYSTILIKKSMMNNEVGFARKVLSVLEHNGMLMEHLPTGIDTMSVIVETSQLKGDNATKVIDEIRAKVSPDSVEIHNDLALIAIVGHGMAEKKGTAAKVFNALYKKDVNIKMIDQGSSEMNIIVGVKEKNLKKSIVALYDEFFN